MVTGALLIPQLGVSAQDNEINGTGQQFSETVVNPVSQGQYANYAAGGNYTTGKQGFGNITTISGLGTTADTTMLKMHIEDPKSANATGDTAAAMNHVILALEEIKMILSGNATSTALAGNMASMNDTTATNSTPGSDTEMMQ